MIIIDRMLIGGVGFVLDKIAAAVDAELNDEDRLREELLAAQMQFELGEIEKREFEALEQTLLGRLREVREARQAGLATEQPGDSAQVTGIEASVDLRHHRD